MCIRGARRKLRSKDPRAYWPVPIRVGGFTGILAPHDIYRQPVKHLPSALPSFPLVNPPNCSLGCEGGNVSINRRMAITVIVLVVIVLHIPSLNAVLDESVLRGLSFPIYF